MFEVIRLEFKQILGGKKKWLVALFLLVPVALTTLTRTVGMAGRARDQMNEKAERGSKLRPIPDGHVVLERTTPGEVRLAGGRIVLNDEGIFVNGTKVGDVTIGPNGITRGGRPLNDRAALFYDGESFVIEDGVISVDPDWDPSDSRWSTFSPNRPDPIPWDTISSIILFLIYPQTLCILLALLYGSSLLGSEIEKKTLTYLFTRPLARWKLILGKYFAIVGALSLPVVTSATISWFVLFSPGGFANLLALAVTCVAGLLAYNAIFVFIGFLIPNRAMITALIYAVFFEFILSFVPALVNMLTVTYYLRSLAVEITQMTFPGELSRIIGGSSIPEATMVLLAMIAIGLALSSVMAAKREYAMIDQV